MPFPPNLLWSLKVNSSQVKHYGSGNGTTPGDISDPFPPSVQGISDKSSPVLLRTLSSQSFSSHERILKDNSEVRGSDERDGRRFMGQYGFGNWLQSDSRPVCVSSWCHVMIRA